MSPRRRLLLLSSAAALAFGGFVVPALSAPPPVRESVAICDPGQNQLTNPGSCATITNGQLSVSGSGGGGGGGGAVYGPSAVGVAPSNPPVYTGGIGTDGYLHGMLSDTNGREIVVGPGTYGTPVGGVLTVQGGGVSGSLPVNDNGGSLTVDTGTGGQFVIGNAAFGLTGNGNTAYVSAANRLLVDGSGASQPVAATATTTAPSYTNNTTNSLSLNTAGGLRVDGSGVTQPVSGTVAATQSGAWNVGAQGSAGTNLLQGLVAATANSLNVEIGGQFAPVQVSGSASAAFTQGVGTAGANSINAYIGGSVALTAAGSSADGATATNPQVSACVYKTTATTYTNGQQASNLCDVNGRQYVDVFSIAAGTNLIGNVGGPETAGSAVTGGGVRVMGSDGTNARDLATATTGELASPKAGTANRVVTKTSLTANTSTTVCPTATNPVSTEIFATSGGVGINLSGGTLTQAAVGTTANTTPDLYIPNANQEYMLPVGSTNAITGYTATAQIVTCVQTLRQ